jgi:hypothetical protein
MARQTQKALLESKLSEAKRLEAEIQRLKNAARDKQRAEDEQRQKIVGRVVLARLKVQADDDFGKAVTMLLSQALTRGSERSLFTVLTMPAEQAPTPQLIDFQDHRPAEEHESGRGNV